MSEIITYPDGTWLKLIGGFNTTSASDGAPKVLHALPRQLHGTLYWGGAGLDGDYLNPTLTALKNAGIADVYVGRHNTAKILFGEAGTFLDAFRAGLIIRYVDEGDWAISTGMNTMEGHFNLIGYSYGSLLAAQTAYSYAKKGVVVDHLVLIASPIDLSFLKTLKSHRNIKKLTIIDLTDKGDMIYAGITQAELVSPTFLRKIHEDFSGKRGLGHFYYAHPVPDLDVRLARLAKFLHEQGLR